jgi:hypothetical protein
VKALKSNLHQVLLCSLFSVGLLFGITGQSLSQVPEELDRLVLTVDPVQYVGHPLRGTAEVLFFDGFNDLVPAYSLVDTPLVFQVSDGSLSPDSLVDQALFNAGVVDLSLVPVIYQGTTGGTDIGVLSGAVISNNVLVSFNGYDLASVTFTDGSPITQLFSGIPTSVAVRVQNNGTLAPDGSSFIRTFFVSGGGSVKVFFDGKANGAIDTVTVLLPDVPILSGEDTLVVEVAADYDVDGSLFRTADTVRIPVTIEETPQIAVVPGSVTPDSIYAGIRFDLGFDAESANSASLIDSTKVTIRLVNDAGVVASTLYDSLASFTVLNDITLQYRNLSIPAEATLIDTGPYRVEMDIAAYSESPTVLIKNLVADTLYLKTRPLLTVNTATLSPLEVVGGASVAFDFEVTFDGSLPANLVGSRTNLSLLGDTFSTTVSLRSADGMLQPGNNLLTADVVDIPVGLAPDTLGIEAIITYSEPGIGNAAAVETDFDQQTIAVLTPIAIQLTETNTAGLPNPPFVNTGQRFEVVGRIDNPSDRAATDVTATIQVVGLSTPDVINILIDTIPAQGDTLIRFGITAGPAPAPLETFTLSLTATGAEVLPPLNNETFVTIQSSAQLRIACDTLSGLNKGYVLTGESFQLGFTLANSGQAAVDPTSYRLTTGGVDLGVPDPSTGSVEINEPLRVSFTAPASDTFTTIRFELEEVPIDKNTGLPATIGETFCEIEVLITSLQADLIAGAEMVTGGLVETGQVSNIFALSLENLGRSGRAPIIVDRLRLTLTLAGGQSADLRSLLETGSTGLYENDTRVATSTGAGEELFLHLPDFVVAPGQTRELYFRTKLKSSAPEDFRITLLADDVQSTYTGGPLADQPSGVISPDGDSVIISGPVTTVASGRLSLTVRDNPFNPHDGPAEFSYLLPEDSGFEFRILTLTGEQVYSFDAASGESGTQAGSHVLEWDGRNGEGEMVFNGVYVAILKLKATGEQVTFKIAVLK